jgi:antitoxin HigA-1
MSTKIKKPKSRDAEEVLNEILGGPLTFGDMVHSLRLCEEISQIELARKLGISRSHLCDIEKGRTLVSPLKAIEYAKILNKSKVLFVQMALQDQVNSVGEPYIVELRKAA